jgi:hypothetical protein
MGQLFFGDDLQNAESGWSVDGGVFAAVRVNP